jgi:chromosome segregation ATPase
MPMSEHCRKTGEQNCHLCENADCTDNTNASIMYLKSELKKVKEEHEVILQVVRDHSSDPAVAAANVVIKNLKLDLNYAKEIMQRAEKQRDEIADECQRFGAKLDSLEKLVVEALITIGGKTIPLKEMVDAVKTARTIGGSTNEIGG